MYWILFNKKLLAGQINSYLWQIGRSVHLDEGFVEYIEKANNETEICGLGKDKIYSWKSSKTIYTYK